MLSFKSILLTIFVVISIILSSCLMSDVKKEKLLSVNLNSRITSGIIIIGISIRNEKDYPVWVDESNLCVDGYMKSELLDVKAIKGGEIIGDVGFKGMIVDRIVENDPSYFKKLAPKEVISCEFKLNTFYKLIVDVEGYEIQYSMRNLAYKKLQPEFEMLSEKIIIII